MGNSTSTLTNEDIKNIENEDKNTSPPPNSDEYVNDNDENKSESIISNKEKNEEKKETVHKKLSLTVIKPKDSIYLLLKDNANIICFSDKREDMVKMLNFIKTQYTIGHYFSFNGIDDNGIDEKSDELSLDVYIRYNCLFLTRYDHLAAKYQVIEVPHYLVSMFNQKKLFADRKK